MIYIVVLVACFIRHADHPAKTVRLSIVKPNQFHEVKDSLQGMTLADTALADFPPAAALGYALHEMER